jgi:hypothetical protein
MSLENKENTCISHNEIDKENTVIAVGLNFCTPVLMVSVRLGFSSYNNFISLSHINLKLAM